MNNPNTIFEQLEVRLDYALRNPNSMGKSRTGQSQSKVAQSIYRTTEQIIKLFESGGNYSVQKEKSYIYGYENDRYIAVTAGHNKWKLFQLCKA